MSGSTASVATRESAVRPLAGIYFVTVLGYSLWRLSFYNYALDELRLPATEIGRLFALASIPGILAFLVGVISRQVAFFVLTAVSTGLLGVGLILLGSAEQDSALWVATLAISWGFVWYMPLANNGTIHENAPGRVPAALGRLKSLGPMATISAAAVIFAFGRVDRVGTLLVVVGGVVLFAGGWAAFRFHRLVYGRSHSRLRLDPNLWPYYLLNFWAGSRSAVFKTVVLSQLVSEYGLSTQQVSATLLAGSVANILSYRAIGRIVTRFRPGNALCLLYVLVAGLFLWFGQAQSLALFLFLFILDSLLFGSAVITDAYLKQAGDANYLTGDLSVGVSAFHLAVLIVAPVAGLVWESYGNDLALLLGAAVCLVAALTSRYLTISNK